MNVGTTASSGAATSFVDDALAAAGRSRRVALAVPHFLVVPYIIASSDLVATLATRVAATFSDALGLVQMPPPFALPKFQMSLAWHERTHQDPPQRWLREQLLAVAADLRQLRPFSPAFRSLFSVSAADTSERTHPAAPGRSSPVEALVPPAPAR